MNFIEKKELKSSEQRNKLKELNNAFTDCISKDFIGRFLNGENVKVEDFCIKEREAMLNLDE